MQCLLGHENGLAVHGTFLHMMNHSLIKLVLFMVAGVVYMNIHQLDLNEIKGFGRGKPFLNVAFLMGALGIGGIPLWNGYISKTLIHESIVEYSKAPLFVFVEWVFLISGGLTVAYMTKLYISLFIEKNADAARQAKFDSMNKHYINKQSMFAIGGSALILPILGMTPGMTMMNLAAQAQEFFRMFEEGHMPHFFSFVCLKGGLISIVVGALVYVFIIRKFLLRGEEYLDAWPKWLDMENLIYRPIVQHILPFIGIFVSRIADCAVDTLIVLLRKTLYKDAKVPFRTGRLPKLDAALGTVMDKGAAYLKNREEQVSYRRQFRRKSLEREVSRDMIRFSLSYGLQLAGIGMVLVMLYLLL